MRYVLFCGPRTWSNYALVRETMRQMHVLLGSFTVLEGGARGADSFARIAAKVLALDWEEVHADWAKHFKRAGKIRNTQMLDLAPEYVVAFWDGLSTGTLDTITKAVNHYRIPTLIVRRD